MNIINSHVHSVAAAVNPPAYPSPFDTAPPAMRELDSGPLSHGAVRATPVGATLAAGGTIIFETTTTPTVVIYPTQHAAAPFIVRPAPRYGIPMPSSRIVPPHQHRRLSLSCVNSAFRSPFPKPPSTLNLAVRDVWPTFGLPMSDTSIALPCPPTCNLASPRESYAFRPIPRHVCPSTLNAPAFPPPCCGVQPSGLSVLSASPQYSGLPPRGCAGRVRVSQCATYPTSNVPDVRSLPAHGARANSSSSNDDFVSSTDGSKDATIHQEDSAQISHLWNIRPSIYVTSPDSGFCPSDCPTDSTSPHISKQSDSEDHSASTFSREVRRPFPAGGMHTRVDQQRPSSIPSIWSLHPSLFVTSLDSVEKCASSFQSSHIETSQKNPHFPATIPDTEVNPLRDEYDGMCWCSSRICSPGANIHDIRSDVSAAPTHDGLSPNETSQASYSQRNAMWPDIDAVPRHESTTTASFGHGVPHPAQNVWNIHLSLYVTSPNPDTNITRTTPQFEDRYSVNDSSVHTTPPTDGSSTLYGFYMESDNASGYRVATSPTATSLFGTTTSPWLHVLPNDSVNSSFHVATSSSSNWNTCLPFNVTSTHYDRSSSDASPGFGTGSLCAGVSHESSNAGLGSSDASLPSFLFIRPSPYVTSPNLNSSSQIDSIPPHYDATTLENGRHLAATLQDEMTSINDDHPDLRFGCAIGHGYTTDAIQQDRTSDDVRINCDLSRSGWDILTSSPRDKNKEPSTNGSTEASANYPSLSPTAHVGGIWPSPHSISQSPEMKRERSTRAPLVPDIDIGTMVSESSVNSGEALSVSEDKNNGSIGHGEVTSCSCESSLNSAMAWNLDGSTLASSTSNVMEDFPGGLPTTPEVESTFTSSGEACACLSPPFPSIRNCFRQMPGFSASSLVDVSRPNLLNPRRTKSGRRGVAPDAMSGHRELKSPYVTRNRKRRKGGKLNVTATQHAHEDTRESSFKYGHDESSNNVVEHTESAGNQETKEIQDASRRQREAIIRAIFDESAESPCHAPQEGNENLTGHAESLESKVEGTLYSSPPSLLVDFFFDRES